MKQVEKKRAAKLGEDGVLRLAGAWSVERVTELRETLLAELAGARPVTVDISGIDWMDTAGVQLLLALVFSLEKGVKIRGANEDVRRVLDVSGTTAVLKTRGVTVDFNVEV